MGTRPQQHLPGYLNNYFQLKQSYSSSLILTTRGSCWANRSIRNNGSTRLFTDDRMSLYPKPQILHHEILYHESKKKGIVYKVVCASIWWQSGACRRLIQEDIQHRTLASKNKNSFDALHVHVTYTPALRYIDIHHSSPEVAYIESICLHLWTFKYFCTKISLYTHSFASRRNSKLILPVRIVSRPSCTTLWHLMGDG